MHHATARDVKQAASDAFILSPVSAGNLSEQYSAHLHGLNMESVMETILAGSTSIELWNPRQYIIDESPRGRIIVLFPSST
ncbi:hypothetical protein CSB45_07070 [candidate division KSB3 bacterium]|uniref:Uncharacterized protein n=1 Tax=candidate division KSB3 bacterium TaxID=2044937 RepID=A0A2G6E663_9BACT|nr:MAG: hypothetical protein CSB45_07070 [candidate division KSB3 bacterium]PIE30009.1 MAG: hypothetical protein CSA57_05525 [candidate division KSB3 bacterium]